VTLFPTHSRKKRGNGWGTRTVFSCRINNGADRLLVAFFPTLKRGANNHCASGAIKIGTGLVCNNQNLPGQRLKFLRLP
jgi:hypothetical protein